MVFSWEARSGKHHQLGWSELAAEFQHSQAERTTADIVRCFRIVLERFEESEFIKYLVAPSPSSLALFFRTSMSQVYQALKELEKHGYETEASSHYAPVILWDPQVRQKTARFINAPGLHQDAELEAAE